MADEGSLATARKLIRAEGQAVISAADGIGEPFLAALALLANCKKKVLVTAVGTSGTIARRLAHLLASGCGMSAFYFHPGEALHGPSAMVEEGDLLIAISKGGKSAELNQFLGIARERGGKVISLTSSPGSDMAAQSDIVLEVPVNPAAEDEGILPFGSTLTTAAIGDALTYLVRRMRGFDLGEMRQTHPSGATADVVAQMKNRTGEE
ncbi:MAG: SIS domain-containing protein [Anaerolineales bacterium]|jgi:arabinose-5-phosphate isomerase